VSLSGMVETPRL